MTAKKKKKDPKLTKKMLSYLDRAEINCLLIEGMEVTPEAAFGGGLKFGVNHIYTEQADFAKADLSALSPEERFRPGVFQYVLDLQRYLNGIDDAPTWPPKDEDIQSDIAKAFEEPVVDAASTKVVAPKEVQVTRLLPSGTYLEQDPEPVTTSPESPSALLDLTVQDFIDAGDSNVESLVASIHSQPGIEGCYTIEQVEAAVREALPTENVVSARGKAIEAPLNTGAPVMKNSAIRFKKVDGFGSGQEQESKAPGLGENDFDYFNETFDNLGEHMDLLNKVVLEKIEKTQSRINSIENALLFVINSAILPKGTIIDSLDEVPPPPYE